MTIGLFFLFKPKEIKKQSPINNPLPEVLGFSKNITSANSEDLISQTKDSLEKNTKNTLDNTKTNVYNTLRNTLDTVFDKQTSNNSFVEVNIENVSNSSIDSEISIDLETNTNLKLDLSVNKKYYLKFKNLPKNYCIYINNDKYPLTDDIIEIQFSKIGNYPIRTSSCDSNDKNVGVLTVK